MECPKCGYMMDAFEKDCPRCKRFESLGMTLEKSSPVLEARPTATHQAPAPSIQRPIPSPANTVLQQPPQYKEVDEIFCPSCGRRVKRDAVICVACGVPINGRLQYASGIQAKDKTVAILLCFFFGLFGWLYTYDIDKGKFWLNLIGVVVTLGYWAIVASLWAFIESLVRSDDFYRCYPNG